MHVFFVFTSRETRLEFAYFKNFHYHTTVEIYWAEDQFGILILRHTWPLNVCNIRSIVQFFVYNRLKFYSKAI